MLFNLEEDSGDRVKGYVVPDGYSTIPRIRVCAGGGEVLAFEANEVREALVEAGRHETGRCGFSIDVKMVPDLQGIVDLELYDIETAILIYRRPRPGNIRRKVLRLETHLFPLWALDSSLSPHFQYFAKGVEDLGRETVTQLFLLNQVDSVYLSGKILYRNYAYFIESGFQIVVMLQDPYEELAERLLVLSKIRQANAVHLGMRESVAFQPAMEFAESLNLQDEKAVRRAIRHMPEDVTALLANPIVRQFTASTPDEMPTGAAVAGALDVLAGAILVGRRYEGAKFVEALAELLEIPADAISRPPRFTSVTPLANILRESGEADLILEKDLELYHYVEMAAHKAP